MSNRALNRLTGRIMVAMATAIALTALVACGSTAPSQSTAPAGDTAPVVQPAASTSGDSPAPTAVPAQASGSPETSDRGKYGGIVSMQDYAFPNLIFHPHEFTNQVKNISGIYNGLLE